MGTINCNNCRKPIKNLARHDGFTIGSPYLIHEATGKQECDVKAQMPNAQLAYIAIRRDCYDTSAILMAASNSQKIRDHFDEVNWILDGATGTWSAVFPDEDVVVIETHLVI